LFWARRLSQTYLAATAKKANTDRNEICRLQPLEEILDKLFSSERLSTGGMAYFLAFLTVVLLSLGCFQLWLLFTTKAEDQFIALGEKHVFFVLDKMEGAFCFPVNEIKAIHLVPNGNAQSLQQRITTWFLEPEDNLGNFLVEAENGRAFMGNDFIHIKLDSHANEVFRHRYAFMLHRSYI
jgi:hypothetical protein